MDAERDIDITLFGATGFVGRLTARHLAAHAPEGVRIALAGRSRSRLETVRDDLGVSWPLLEVDAADAEALAGMARRSRVVVTTVGPYITYGLPLVEACAEAGTHYADLTGEVLFVRESIDRCHEAAQRTGARIVHSCGFDSIPSDLGVLETARRAAADGAGTLTRTTLYVRSLKGGLSGGTIDSMRQQTIMARADASAREVIADAYALGAAPPSDGAHEATTTDATTTGATTTGATTSSPQTPDPATQASEAGTPAGGGPVQAVVAATRQGVGSAAAGAGSLVQRAIRAAPVRREDSGRWTGPFVMATYNTRVVRRSNALLDFEYGTGFRYAEVTDFGRSLSSPVQAWGMTAVLLGLVAGLSFAPTRHVLDRVLPAPGDGPDEQARAQGRFRLEIDAITTSGARYRTTVAAQADPGYNGTAIMLGQAALCLVLDADRLPDRAGVLTPATGLGEPLAERLRAAGFTLDTRRLSS